MIDEKVVITNDKAIGKGKDTEADRSLTEGPYVKIESVEQLKELAEAAERTHSTFLEYITSKMTDVRAAEIKGLRVDQGYTWRAVAKETHEAWGDDAGWEPPSNQLAGMALCEAAAKRLGENYMEEPWN